MTKRHKAVSIAALIVATVMAGSLARIIASERRANARLAELQKTAPTFFEQARAFVSERQFEQALEKITYALVLRPNEAEFHALQRQYPASAASDRRGVCRLCSSRQAAAAQHGGPREPHALREIAERE